MIRRFRKFWRLANEQAENITQVRALFNERPVIIFDLMLLDLQAAKDEFLLSGLQLSTNDKTMLSDLVTTCFKPSQEV
jgi:hypothetical protein